MQRDFFGHVVPVWLLGRKYGTATGRRPLRRRGVAAWYSRHPV